MSTIYLNIGSNRGDRRDNINRAVAAVAQRWPRAVIRRSPWVESQPWGYDSEQKFVNLGIALDFESTAAMPDAFAVLRAIKEIETTLAPDDRHRNPDGSYRDRIIDIDIIAIDNMAIDTPELTIPHPRAQARAFVMQPMQFLWPGWNPAHARYGLKKTIADMHRDTLPQFKAKPKTPLTLVLDNVRSLNNIGSMFRTADAFAIHSIVLCGICATPPSAEIHKTALGAEMSVDWTYFSTTLQAIEHLQKQGCHLCCLEQVKGSVPLNTFTPDKDTHYALVVGNEVTGVDEAVVARCDTYLEIPQQGTKHSLNVAVSAAIAMWRFFAPTLTQL